MHPLFYLAALIPVVLLRRRMASKAISKMSSPSTLVSVDLAGYDAEQCRLMDERCIVVDENDKAIGALDKKTCHLMENINKGLLHRAFSVFVFRPSDGRLLLQQRASEKITFPDMWTNTCCSHPLDDFEIEREEKHQLGMADPLSFDICVVHSLTIPGSPRPHRKGVRVAASRKLEHELGIPQSQTPVDEFQYLTRIHYLAPSNGLWVDYILFFTGDVDVKLNANEIRDYKYVSKEELQKMFDDPGQSPLEFLSLMASPLPSRLFTHTVLQHSQRIPSRPGSNLLHGTSSSGWWDELLSPSRMSAPSAQYPNGRPVATNLADLMDDRVIKMV
ncbi:hypothetical protein BS47DRAFT_1405120 [Hydnum rufescens UP504]|uniref:isopentenyl-diphosphate Delta-isomerase n=1 Tax=Hydnum rufescens UP504 TaxID=1448309 RepID=A0A9P6B7Y7_9AGAM|nr:hypothetical protein BS47DRAFT_1405120 [Hydnum rufescens UP504]